MSCKKKKHVLSNFIFNKNDCRAYSIKQNDP